MIVLFAIEHQADDSTKKDTSAVDNLAKNHT